MKRILSILIIIALMLASVLAVIPTSAATGTAINTADEFLAMDPAGSYYLAADIELTAPFDADFKGSLDGNGKTITVAASALSAFKKISNGQVYGLTVKADYSVSEPNTFGVLARKASGVFTDITVDANVVVLPEANSFKGGAGLLFGEIVGNATLNNCVSKGSIDVQTKTHPNNDDSALLYGVGGMVGRITTGAVSFVGCENYAFVNTLQAGMPAGGLVGETAGSASIQLSFENCVNYGEVITFGVPSGEGNAHTGAGGILGEALGVHSPDSTFTFKNCANHGYIHANEECGRVAGIGGIVGRGYSPAVLTIDGCINTADLDAPGTGWSAAGGIVGTLMTYGFAWSGTHDGKIKILNCVNLGDLNAANAFAGGIVGAPFQFNTQNSELYFENCANYGAVTGKDLTAGITPYAGWYGLSGIIFKNCLNAGAVTSTAGSASGIIVRINKLEEKTYSGTPNPTLIEGCVNIGTIISSGDNGTASGILGVVDTDDTTIKNCMNMGALTGIKASAYIMPEATNTVTAEGNVYFGEADDSMKYGSAADIAVIEERIVAVSALVPFDSSSLCDLVKEASEFNSADFIGGWDAFASALEAAKLVANRASSQADVDAAKADLDAAILGLESPERADFAALDAAIADAAAYAGKEASYTPASWSAFAKALADAETLRSGNPKQTAVDAAAAALSAAIAGLTAKADIAPLEAELAKHSSYVESEYVATTWSAFASAKTAAEALKIDVNASDADVASAVKALAEAAAALDKKASADQLSALSAKVTAADSEHPSDNYTSSSYQALRNAIKAINDALKADTGVSQIAVLEKALEDAIAVLKVKGDFTELDALVDSVDDYKESDVAGGFDALKEALTAIENAKKPASILNISADDVASLKAALEAAIDGLVFYADFTDLDTLIAHTSTLVEADYTAESWAALQSALKAANDLKAKVGATAPEAQAAHDTLKAAIGSLASAATEPGESDILVDKKEGCGGVIGATAVVLTAVLGLGAVALKKREN